MKRLITVVGLVLAACCTGRPARAQQTDTAGAGCPDAQVLKAGKQEWIANPGSRRLKQWDCLAGGEEVTLAPEANNGQITIIYHRPAIPPHTETCTDRTQCRNGYVVERAPKQPEPPSAFRAVREFFWSFFRSGEPKPVPGILRGYLTTRPSVLCTSSNGTVDLSPALRGDPGEEKLRFLPSDRAPGVPPMFTLQLNEDRKPYITDFSLSPGLYLLDLRDTGDLPKGEAFSLVASPSSCTQLTQAFILAVRYTETWPKDTPPDAVAAFQSVYLQALAHNRESAPVSER